MGYLGNIDGDFFGSDEQEARKESKIRSRWSALGREISFWVVPPHDGRVRKFRFSIRKLLVAGALSGLIGGGVLFITGDYVRSQLLRTKIYFTLKSVLRERDHLERDNLALRSEMAELAKAQDRTIQFEKGVKARLEELESLLGLAEELGVISPLDVSPSRSSSVVIGKNRSADIEKIENSEGDSNGVGGAERECDPRLDGSLCNSATPKISSKKSSANGRASLDWGRSNGSGADKNRDLVNQISFAGPQGGSFDSESLWLDQSLVERLDQVIYMIRSLPISLPGDGHIRSGFGLRISPFSGKLKLHEGIDLSLPLGSSIYSTGDGIVKNVERNKTYGLMVDISHGNGVVTRYAHLSQTFLALGDRVCKGEVIGLVGSTGRSTGPHLHYEIRVNGIPRDPERFFELGRRLALLSSVSA